MTGMTGSHWDDWDDENDQDDLVAGFISCFDKKKKFKDFLRTFQGQISHSSRTPIIALSICLF